MHTCYIEMTPLKLGCQGVETSNTDYDTERGYRVPLVMILLNGSSLERKCSALLKAGQACMAFQ